MTALWSCSDDDFGGGNSIEKFSVNATFEADDDVTRATLGEGNKVVWEIGDKISLFDVQPDGNTKNSELTLAGGQGTTNGLFTGIAPKSECGYMAVYPYSQNIEYTCGSKSSSLHGLVTISNVNLTTQNARKGNIPSGVPMIAYVDAPSNNESNIYVKYKNIYAFMKFTITYKCKSVVITPNAGGEALQMNTIRVMMCSNDGLPTLSGTSDKVDKSVTLVDKDGGVIQPGTYYIAVLPGTLTEGFTMTIKSPYTNDTYEKTTTKQVTLKRNTILNLGTIDNTSLRCMDGYGTKQEPYKIYDYCDLETMSQFINDKKAGYAAAYYQQMNDVDFENRTLTPIGAYDNLFTGSYDGGNHYIKDITYGKSSYESAMFAYIKNATLKNIYIDNITIDTDANKISGLVAHAFSEDNKVTIENCHVGNSNGKVWTVSEDVTLWCAGIIARSNCNLDIKNCSNDISFDLTLKNTHTSVRAGGIIAYASGEQYSPLSGSKEDNGLVSMKNCRNSGNITIHGGGKDIDYSSTEVIIAIGGMIGQAVDMGDWQDVACQIYSCVNSGKMTETNCVTGPRANAHTSAGGIIGMNDSDGYGVFTEVNPILCNCLNTGAISCDDEKYKIGGIVGWVYDGDTTFKYCVNTGSISGEDKMAMYGYDKAFTSSPKLVNCYCTFNTEDGKGCSTKKDIDADFMNKQISGQGYAQWKSVNGGLDLEI